MGGGIFDLLWSFYCFFLVAACKIFNFLILVFELLVAALGI